MHLYEHAARMWIPSIKFNKWVIRSTLATNFKFLSDFLNLTVTRLGVLLMVGAMCFVAIRAAIAKELSPYVHISVRFDMGETIMHAIPTSFFLTRWGQMGVPYRPSTEATGGACPL